MRRMALGFDAFLPLPGKVFVKEISRIQGPLTLAKDYDME